MVRDLLLGEYLPRLRLHEFYQCDPAALCEQLAALCSGEAAPDQRPCCPGQLRLLPDPRGLRFGRSVDLQLARRAFFRDGLVAEMM